MSNCESGEGDLREVNQNVFEKIQSMPPEELSQIILNVTNYAARLLGINSRIIEREPLYTADDLALEAIGRVLDGRRNWDPDKEPDFAAYLRSVVKSIYNHEVTDRIKREKVLVNPENSDNQDIIENLPLESQQLQDLENEEFKNRILEMFRREEEQLVLLCYFEGMHKPREIARELEVDVKEIYRIRRNIERKILSSK